MKRKKVEMELRLSNEVKQFSKPESAADSGGFYKHNQEKQCTIDTPTAAESFLQIILPQK